MPLIEVMPLKEWPSMERLRRFKSLFIKAAVGMETEVEELGVIKLT